MDISFTSAVVILLLVMDPIGNIPLFVSVLRPVKAARRTGVWWTRQRVGGYSPVLSLSTAAHAAVLHYADGSEHQNR